ncbi:MAG: DUF1289 domain-containing protein [Betaproteobacteria bacterium]|nr:DUF1289 domain-containing protein [Betaproteobacteria bacterium]
MADEAAVPSPCMNVCVMNEAGEYCTGCYRTLAEIANWTDYTVSERCAVLERLGARRAAAERHH